MKITYEKIFWTALNITIIKRYPVLKSGINWKTFLKQINYQSLPSSTSMDFGPDGEELILRNIPKRVIM